MWKKFVSELFRALVFFFLPHLRPESDVLPLLLMFYISVLVDKSCGLSYVDFDTYIL